MSKTGPLLQNVDFKRAMLFLKKSEFNSLKEPSNSPVILIEPIWVLLGICSPFRNIWIVR